MTTTSYDFTKKKTVVSGGYSLENHSFLDVSARKCLAESVSGGLSLKKSAHMTDG